MAAIALTAVPAHAGQNDPRLARLFVALKSTESPGWARTLEDEITHIWSQTPDSESQQLMEKGLTLMAEDEDEAALKAFDALIAHAPDFAEGWNKRATVEFLLGDYQASMVDIAHTLKLEPRHFGALAGLGEVELALGNKEAALNAFNQALAIDPHLGDVAEMADNLKKELAGKAI
ncbi:MAG TPA: tetratricopeptide repeat protein [Stellaceae bacterium]|jgi:tetratricopeptide (TPR) repeat protein|nr:tetratricopeptide repeat protein [Stellaceae bacterium]